MLKKWYNSFLLYRLLICAQIRIQKKPPGINLEIATRSLKLLGGLNRCSRLGNQFLGESDNAIFDAGLEWT